MEGKAQLLVGVDPMSDVLVIVEADRALADTSLIRTLVDSRTLGQVRAGDPRALALVSDYYSDTRDPSDEESDLKVARPRGHAQRGQDATKLERVLDPNSLRRIPGVQRFQPLVPAADDHDQTVSYIDSASRDPPRWKPRGDLCALITPDPAGRPVSTGRATPVQD